MLKFLADASNQLLLFYLYILYIVLLIPPLCQRNKDMFIVKVFLSLNSVSVNIYPALNWQLNISECELIYQCIPVIKRHS